MPDQVQFAGHWHTWTTHAVAGDVLKRMKGGHSDYELRGGFGHPGRYTHESGAEIYCGNSQVTCVNVRGEASETWFKKSCEWCQDLGGETTRMDLAADLFPEQLARRRIIEMERAWKRELVDTRINPHKHTIIKGDDEGEGWTAYYGGRTSDYLLRVYDRRGPLRLEHQYRPHGPPRNFLAPIALKPDGIPRLWRTLAYKLVFPMDWYQALLRGSTLELAGQVEEDTTLQQFFEQFTKQYGAVMTALHFLGVDVDPQLRSDWPKKLDGHAAAKFTRWADEAKDMGYDGTRLRSEVRCRLKSAHRSNGAAATQK